MIAHDHSHAWNFGYCPLPQAANCPNMFDVGSSSIFWLNGENGEPTVVGPSESAAVGT